MNVAPPDLSEADLLDACHRWDPEIDCIEHLPLGFGSHHWRALSGGSGRYFLTVDDLDTKTWLGEDRDSAFDGLSEVFHTAWALRDSCGLDFVVAPIEAQDHELVVRLSERYSLAVFPLVGGVPAGEWGEPRDRSCIPELVHCLAAVHGSAPAVRPGAPRDDFRIPGRAALEEALDRLGEPWHGAGPLGEPARLALLDGRELLRHSVVRFDELAISLSEQGERAIVVTHGEPHPGNILVDDEQRLHLVDWDTLAVGPPERDLWMLAGDADGLSLYTSITGVSASIDAMSFYRLGWVLKDVVAFVGVLRAEHELDADTEKTFRALRLSLVHLGESGGAELPWT